MDARKVAGVETYRHDLAYMMKVFIPTSSAL